MSVPLRVAPFSPLDRSVSARRASEMLGVSMDCLRKWRYIGIGPSWFRVSMTSVAYDVDSIVATIDAGGVHGVWKAVLRRRAENSGTPTGVAVRAAVAAQAASVARTARRARLDALDPEVLREAERIVAERRLAAGRRLVEESRGKDGLA